MIIHVFISRGLDNDTYSNLYSYDNIGDAGCDSTPEEIKLVKNIIKQIKTNEKTKVFTCDYGN